MEFVQLKNKLTEYPFRFAFTVVLIAEEESDSLRLVVITYLLVRLESPSIAFELLFYDLYIDL